MFAAGAVVPVACGLPSALSLAPLLDAKVSHYPQLLAATFASFYAASFSGLFFGDAFAAWTGSFVLGILANFYGRFFKQPQTEMTFYAILLLGKKSFSLPFLLSPTNSFFLPSYLS